MSDEESALFVRDGDEIIGSFAAEYATVVRALVSQTGTLLGQPADLADPGLARLFPDVYPDSDAESAEFRRLTEEELRTGKVESADTVLATLPAEGGEVRLSEDDAAAWLRALNDIRLLLGSRLDLDDDTDPMAELTDELRRDPESPRVPQLAAYGYLGGVQESLVLALAGW